MTSITTKIDTQAVKQRPQCESKTKKNQKRDALIAQHLSAFLTIIFLDEEIKHQLAHQLIAHQSIFWYTFSRISKIIHTIDFYISISFPLLLILFSSFLMNGIVNLYKYPLFNTQKDIFIHIVLFTLLTLIFLLITLAPLVVASIIFFYLIKHLLLKLAYVKYPSHFIIDNLIEMLIIMQEELDCPLSIYSKRRLIKLLEHTARCFERDLPRKLSAEDTITKGWMRGKFKQVGAALREEKKWILLPKEGARETFIKNIVSTLIYFVTDNWDALNGKEPEKLTLPQLRNTIVAMLANALKTILIAALPIVGFFFIIQPFFHLTGATFDTIVSILSIFTVSVLASAFDPNFSTHLANAKDIESFLPRSGSKH